jgi:hypothetical protein
MVGGDGGLSSAGAESIERVRLREAADDDAWDDLITRSWNGTLLHTRRFLGYHGNRFDDRSLVAEDQHGVIRAVLPAAVDPTRTDTVSSHPGATYGGIVHDGWVHGSRATRVMGLMTSYYRTLGFDSLRYRPVPSIYHRVPAQDDLYALFRFGAYRQRCDLSSTIDLALGYRMTKGRRASLKRAGRLGVSVRWDHQALDEFWPVLGEALTRRHGARPVHSLEEITLLAELFPDEISLAVVRVDHQIVGGAVFFHCFPVLHLQYLATTASGLALGAADVVIEAGMMRATEDGYRYFDFGISTEDQGQTLNDSLYRFKASFGAGGITYEEYEIDLTREPLPSIRQG